MLTPAEITDLARGVVQCKSHGEQRVFYCCPHVLRGAPAAHFRTACPKLPGLALCGVCEKFIAPGTSFETTCACCVDRYVVRIDPDPLAAAHAAAVADFLRLRHSEHLIVGDNPYAPGTDEAWAWDMGWGAMAFEHRMRLGLAV